MPRSTLSGTRIRALRLSRRLAQGDLARAAGVSPSYLNLIEHNRRRAGPRLISAIAGALGVAPETLAEDAGDALVEALRLSGAAALADPPPETDRAEEFAGRFPGWAGHTAALQARVEAQDRTVERLIDRMAHDPKLSEALHEIVSAVTAVQSTAAILVEAEDLEPEWRAKFHDNIHADSQRLANAAEALVAYLDLAGGETGAAAPQEEVESWLARHGFHLPAIEDGVAGDRIDALIAGLIEGQPELASQAARRLARDWLEQAAADAAALPLARLVPALTAMIARGPAGFAPEMLAAGFGVGLPQLFRRLAGLPVIEGVPRFGLVVCDGSGSLTFRRPVEGFALPRFGGACPVWPLFAALQQPGRPLRQWLETTARPPHRFLAHAVAGPRGPARFEPPHAWEALMLLVPAGQVPPGAPPPLPVGSSCRVCPLPNCPARREPSIVA